MKIIRNIDGKKLELTLTNEEAMSVFMDVFLTRTNSRIVQRTDCSAEGTEFRGAVQAGYFFRAGLRRNTKAG